MRLTKIVPKLPKTSKTFANHAFIMAIISFRLFLLLY